MFPFVENKRPINTHSIANIYGVNTNSAGTVLLWAIAVNPIYSRMLHMNVAMGFIFALLCLRNSIVSSFTAKAIKTRNSGRNVWNP